MEAWGGFPLIWAGGACLATGLLVYYSMGSAPLDFTNETVLITGAGGGLGWELAHSFLERKCKRIILWDINTTALENCKESLIKEGGSTSIAKGNHIISQTVDVSSLKSIEAAVQELHDQGIDISVLVNNAGVVRPGLLTDLDDADFLLSFNVNVIAHFRLLKLLVPKMKEKNHGTIVTVSSVTAHLGVAYAGSYVSSKAAASSLHEANVQELRKYSGIRTILCEFGRLDTAMFAKSDMSWAGLAFPDLRVDSVAKGVVKKVSDRFEGTLTWPIQFHFHYLFVALPLRWRVFINDLAGGNEAMVPLLAKSS